MWRCDYCNSENWDTDQACHGCREKRGSRSIPTTFTKIYDLVHQHYLQRALTIRDSAIYKLVDGSDEVKQMDTPEVHIDLKLSPFQTAAGQLGYAFRVSSCPDQVWKAIFQVFFSEAPITFSNDRISIFCSPNELGLIYHRVREAIDRTNVAYRAAIPQVRHLAEAQDAAHLQHKREIQEGGHKIQEAFDKLEL